MAQIGVKPIKISKALLRISRKASPSATEFTELGDYEKHVSKVEFTPKSSSTEWKGLDPSAVFVFPGASTWTCAFAFAQDWTTPNSLSRLLYDAEGEELEFEFEPAAGGPAITAIVTAVPGAMGGEIDKVAAASVTLPVQGRPQLEPVA